MTREEIFTRPVDKTELTTVWADGQVYRQDIYGRCRRLPNSTPSCELPDLLACRRPVPKFIAPPLEEVDL